MELREKLAMLRKQQGLTQGELALRVGVTRQAVSKWERGIIAPATVNLIALGRLYGVSLDELVNGELPPEETPPAAEAEEPEAETRRRPGWLKIAGSAILAVCLLLMAAASVIIIGSAIFKEPELPEDGLSIIGQDDTSQEFIDQDKVKPWDGVWEIIGE